MGGVRIRAGALALIFVVGSSHYVLAALRSPSGQSGTATEGLPYMSLGRASLGTFVHRMVNGRAVCREASIEEAQSIRARDPNLPLILLTPDPAPSPRRGLSIILRGTPQLQSSPAAIEAFKRAATRWEPLIRTVVTVVIDVDFGPTLFSKRFDDDAVAAADSQVLGGNSLYPAVRSDLISGPYPPEQHAFYASLPPRSVPTDTEDSTGVMASSATLRALGLIDPIAAPDQELSDFGPPPAIGLNSRFKFDFDSSDGIDQDKFDFESIAAHEIGHVLGFVSAVGQQEMEPALEVAPSVWDLFRLRPDSINGFATAQRILSSGGEQVFYAGGAKLALSTARPDGTGGDGNEASHWKDDNLTGRFLGVMDPSIGPGKAQPITDDDLGVLEAIGYRTKSLADPTIVVPLNSGVAQAGAMAAPPAGLGVLSHTHYSIEVAPGATQLRIDLIGNQDVDLFVRFGHPVFNNGHTVEADYGSTTESGSETITVTSSSFPALRPGIYYVAVANFGPGDADFAVIATVAGGNSTHVPAIFNIDAHLEGDALELDCAAADRDGDFARAEVTILDEAGLAVSPPSSFAVSSGDSIRVQTELAIGGMTALPGARLARVVFVDRAGNRSAEALVDLGKGEAGGLTVTSASFSGSKLILKVRGVAAGLELEINGQVVDRKIKVNGSASKLTIKGKANQLGLKPGANRIRVENMNGWSGVLILNL